MTEVNNSKTVHLTLFDCSGLNCNHCCGGSNFKWSVCNNPIINCFSDCFKAFFCCKSKASEINDISVKGDLKLSKEVKVEKKNAKNQRLARLFVERKDSLEEDSSLGTETEQNFVIKIINSPLQKNAYRAKEKASTKDEKYAHYAVESFRGADHTSKALYFFYEQRSSELFLWEKREYTKSEIFSFSREVNTLLKEIVKTAPVKAEKKGIGVYDPNFVQQAWLPILGLWAADQSGKRGLMKNVQGVSYTKRRDLLRWLQEKAPRSLFDLKNSIKAAENSIEKKKAEKLISLLLSMVMETKSWSKDLSNKSKSAPTSRSASPESSKKKLPKHLTYGSGTLSNVFLNSHSYRHSSSVDS